MTSWERQFAQYEERAKSWINTEAKRLRSPCSATKTEELQRLAAEPFRWLLINPVGPTCKSHPAAGIRKLAESLATDLGLNAVGVHSAGEYLAVGRCSEIWVSQEAIAASTPEKRTDQQMSYFLSLFNMVYRHILGRQHTLVHTLLHSATKDGRILEIPLALNHLRGANLAPFSYRGLFCKTLRLGDSMRHLCSPDLLQRFVSTLWEHVPQLEGAWRKDSNSDEEAIGLIGRRIVTRLLEKDTIDKARLAVTTPRHPWYCFATTFERNTHRAIDSITSKPPLAATLTRELFGETPTKGDEHFVSLSESVKMLQLFFLYRAICGLWFYVVVPKRQRELQMCFTIGSQSRLNSEQLRRLSALAVSTRDELKHYFEDTATRVENPSRLKDEWRDVNEIIGRDRALALTKKGLKQANRANMVSGGLADYLLFCRRISELAVHEGKKLRFDVIVAGGSFASERLAKVCRFSIDETESPWTAARDKKGGRREANEEIISQLLGNYAFLQEPDVILFGSRDGYLLYLARALDGPVVPETLTRGGECYLLRVGVRGDIGIYYDGKLVLWRRAGDYLVPQLYGEEYRRVLRDWLSREFPSEAVDYGVLCEVVWSITSEGKGGASFVIGDFRDGPFPLEKHTYKLSKVFPLVEGLPLVGKGGQELLQQLAVQDGAVAIDTVTGRVFGRRQLLPSEPFDWNQEKDRWKKGGWMEWYKVLRWGTRHHSALAFSSGAALMTRADHKSPAAVITVSSDGDIHVFSGKSPVQKLTYPQPSE